MREGKKFNLYRKTLAAKDELAVDVETRAHTLIYATHDR